MRFLPLGLTLIVCLIRRPCVLASNEAEIRSNPKVTICSDVLPPPDDCYEVDGDPLLQTRYPMELKTGCFTKWTVESYSDHALDLVLDRDEKSISLWGRMKHSGMDVIVHVPDIMVYGPYRENSIRWFAVWRARSLKNDMVVVEDEAMKGVIVFFFDGRIGTSPAQMEISLGGAGLARAGWIEGKLENVHNESTERALSQSIKAEWQAMGNETRKADRQKVQENWGWIRDYSKDEL